MTDTITPLVCSECGEGNYREEDMGHTFECDECAHEINPRVDIAPYLDEGESLDTVDGLLSVVS